MSRRKQSNPKPLLKREDEGWGSDGDPGAAAAQAAETTETAEVADEDNGLPSPKDGVREGGASSPGEAVSPGDPGSPGQDASPEASTPGRTPTSTAASTAASPQGPAGPRGSPSPSAGSPRPRSSASASPGSGPGESPAATSPLAATRTEVKTEGSRPQVVDLSEDRESSRESRSGDAVNAEPADRERSAAGPGTTSTTTGGGGGPRLRLNPSLATDPAAGAAALPSGGARRDFLAALPPAFSAALVSRGLYLPGLPGLPGLAGLPGLPRAEAVAAAAAAAALLPAVQPGPPGAAAAPAQPPPAEPTEARQVAFRCEPCGIRFSSMSTLEAHQTYYCSHRPNAQGPKGPIVEADVDGPGGDGGDLAPRADSADGNEAGPGAAPAKRPATGGQSAAAAGGPPSQTPKQYSCPQCSYSADKKVSLNRHMRMHTASPPAATGAVAPTLPLPMQVQTGEAADAASSFVDRYCQDCDIRFSSLKTFRAHKLHYCSTRHVLKGSAATGSSESASPSPVEAGQGGQGGQAGQGAALPTRAAAGSPGHAAHPNEALLALPTNPPLLVPYSLLQAASVVQGAALSAALGVSAGAALGALGAACLLWHPDGSLQPVATANLPSPARPRPAAAPATPAPPQPAPSPSPQQHSQQPTSAPSRRHRDTRDARDTKQASPVAGSGGADGGPPAGLGPLDLSVRRASDCSDADMEDDDVHVQEHEREDIVCAPNIPLMLSASPACSSPSPAPPPGLGPSPSPPPTQQAASRKRPHSPALSPTERVGKKSPRRTPNGVVHGHSAPKKDGAVSPVLGAGSGPSPGSGPAGPDAQLLLQSVLASRGLAPAQLPLLLGSPLGSPLELALRMAAVSAAELQQQVGPPPPPPQVHVKHGVSKCKECNIVFCRHENYLAHKRHYCQARLQEDAASAEANNAPSPGAATGASRSPSASSPPEPAAAPAAPATTHVQYICARCHIKFTSLDNLTHHQAYYCPKRNAQDGPGGPGPVPGKAGDEKARRQGRCPKCKAAVPADQASSHQCDAATTGAGSGGWRCPCCPVSSPTISAAQRHMETHNGIKAFRCTLCGYKGNTLRGMRTHIRMHFEKGVPDLQEENFITCVMEDDAAIPAPAPGPVAAPLATPPTPPTASSLAVATDASSLPGMARPGDADHDRQYTCDHCSFTSTHKSHIVHHMKHMHGRQIFDEANLFRTKDDQRRPSSCNGADKVTIKEEKHDEDYIAIEDLKVKEEPVFAGDVEDRTSVSLRASPLIIDDSKASLKSIDEMNRSDDAVSANNNKTGPKYCKSCDISFTLYDNFMTHKKFYCTRSEPDGKVAQASAL